MPSNFLRTRVAIDAKAVTPSDSAANVFSRLYVGGTGNVALVTADGTTVTFSGVPAGGYIDVATSQVLSTNTTATLILGLL
jgi:hypothetical protein